MTEPARLTHQDIAARFNNAAALLASALPRLGSPLEELRREFHARITALPVVAPVTLHNDFHWNQVRIRLRQYALLDMERTCLGDPLVDVANFAVEVRLLAQRSDVVVSAEEARRWSEAFCFQWVAATGRPIDPARFHVYAAMAAVKLGAAMVRHLRPGWEQLAVNCVREAESHLQRLGAAVTEVTA